MSVPAADCSQDWILLVTLVWTPDVARSGDGDHVVLECATFGDRWIVKTIFLIDMRVFWTVAASSFQHNLFFGQLLACGQVNLDETDCSHRTRTMQNALPSSSQGRSSDSLELLQPINHTDSLVVYQEI